MGARQTWLVPDHRVEQEPVDPSKSAVVKRSCLLHYLKLVKAWACDKKWNWQLKCGRGAEETNATKQTILCCDSSATHGAMKRKDSRLAERDASSCKRSFCNNGPRDLVQMGTSEILADCLTNMQSTPNSIHLSRLGLGINSGREQI